MPLAVVGCNSCLLFEAADCFLKTFACDNVNLMFKCTHVPCVCLCLCRQCVMWLPEESMYVATAQAPQVNWPKYYSFYTMLYKLMVTK